MPEPPVAVVANASRTGSKVAIVVAVLAVLGAGGIYFSTRPVHFSNASASGPNVAYTFPLETFVVNLSGGGRSYLRVGIALGLSHPPARKEDLPVARARDTILSIISAVKPEELAQPEGKEKLKGQILQSLKDRLPQLGVEDVYFTEFLVQM